ncbi:MAG: hypothetical protein IPM48_03315 [Saprospiraceae bacterium]|nr:hypothetical protein [Saprospiraceae bacterium]
MYLFQRFSFRYFLFLILAVAVLSSCNRGYGCPTEEYHTELDKKGNPKKKPNSGLWDKKQKMYSKGKPKKSDKRKPKKNRTN